MDNPITHSRVLAISLPIVISNATIPLLGIVDTGVVGQLGEAAPIGAVALGATILTTIYWVFGFLRMGTAGLAAQALGAKDRDETEALLSRSLIIGLGAGGAIILLHVPLIAGALWLSPASAEVEPMARSYMQIRVFSAPAMIALYGLTGWLVAQERTTSILTIQLSMNLVNMALNVLFVLGFGWGVEGVAIATFISEWGGFGLAMWLCRGGFTSGAWRKWALIFDRIRLWHMMAVNRDILIRSVLLMAGFTSFTFFGSALGDVELAANQILIQFIFVTAYALDGFAFAAESLVGQALGAMDQARLRRGAMLTSFWGLVVVVFLSVSFAAGGAAGIDLLTTAEEVRAEARIYLPWMIVAPLIGVASWMLDGIFIGATRSADMRNMMAISFVIYVLSVWILFPLLGNHGLWASLMIFFAARGITLAWRYPALERAANRVE